MLEIQKAMRIGVDGSVLHQKYESGQKRYLVNLLDALSKIDSSNDYYIYSHTSKGIPKKENFKFIKLPTWLPLCKRQLVIPILSYKNKIDIFHFPDTWGSVFPPCKRVVITYHDMSPKSSYPAWNRSLKYYFMGLLNRIITKSTAKYASKIIFVSSSVNQEYQRLYGSSKKLITIKEGLSSFFTDHNQKRKPFFIAFADFSPRKNIERVLFAYRLFLEKLVTNHKFKLIIVTSTNYPKKAVMKIVEKYKITKSVKIRTNISDTSLSNMFNQAAGLIYTSLYEGFGLPILESFACGCPVITSNYGATKEVSGGAALLVDPYSVKEIAEAINRIATSDVLKGKLKESGFERIQNFSWERTARKTLRVYKKIYENK